MNCRVIYSLLIVAIIWCLVTVFTPNEGTICNYQYKLTDAEIYTELVDRVGHGQSYHTAIGTLFREIDYPVHSAFNFRQPVIYWVYGAFPDPLYGQVLLAILGATILVGMFLVFRAEVGSTLAAACCLPVVGAVSWCCAGKFHLYTELWAGFLIALSLLAYFLNWRIVPILLGIAACFFRELAFPYAVVALAYTVYQRRFRESLGWLVGIIAYLLFLRWHILQVEPYLPVTNKGMSISAWLYMGGLSFVLATAEINQLFLLFVPTWLVAFYVPIGLFGLLLKKSETNLLIFFTLATYLAAFAIVGRAFYWGFLYSPLLPFGVCGLVSDFVRRMGGAKRPAQPAIGPSAPEPATEPPPGRAS